MEIARLQGAAACPKAFRHGFGASNIQAGIPVTLLQRWLGHARLSTTAIYTDVSGAEEFELAERYWRWSRTAQQSRRARACACKPTRLLGNAAFRVHRFRG
jgi:integrase